MCVLAEWEPDGKRAGENHRGGRERIPGRSRMLGEKKSENVVSYLCFVWFSFQGGHQWELYDHVRHYLQSLTQTAASHPQQGGLDQDPGLQDRKRDAECLEHEDWVQYFSFLFLKGINIPCWMSFSETFCWYALRRDKFIVNSCRGDTNVPHLCWFVTLVTGLGEFLQCLHIPNASNGHILSKPLNFYVASHLLHIFLIELIIPH